MKVNGEQIALTEATTLEKFLESQGYNIQRIAVERNDEIVPRESFSELMLDDNDTIEVVHFMGGGGVPPLSRRVVARSDSLYRS